MASVIEPNSSKDGALLVPKLVARRMTPGSDNPVERQNFAELVADVQIQTRVNGANAITVYIVDPGLSLISAGILATDDEGELPILEISLDGVTYRLDDVSGSLDQSSANIQLELQTRGTLELREKLGPKKGERATNLTRAEFIKARVDEANLSGAIHFYCPELAKEQPIGENATLPSGNARAERKLRGIAPKASGSHKAPKAKKSSSGLTHKNATSGQTSTNLSSQGVSLSATQTKVAQELLDVAASHNAGTVATEALIFAAIAESNLGGAADTFTPNSAGCSGVLQEKDAPNPRDTAGMASRFLLGSSSFQSGGAIALSRTVSDPIQVAVRVEVPSIWPDNAYARESGYANFLPEARKIIAAHGGSSTGSSSSGSSSSSSGGSSEKPVEFAIAAGEDYWTGLQKLAQEVNWMLWFEGNTLYYMHAFELIRAKPLCTIDPIKNQMITNASVDTNTGQRVYSKQNITKKGDISTFTFDVNNGLGDKAGGVSTECTLDLTCEPGFVHAGDVIQLTDENGHAPWSTGPWDGRWIVTDCVRSIFNTYSALTLAVPGSTNLPAPIDEPKGEAITPPASTSNPGTTPGTTPSSAPTASGNAAAIRAFNAADKLSRMQLPYVWGGGHEAGGLLTAGKAGGHGGVKGLDCSGSVCWVLHEAGLYPSTTAIDSTELEKYGNPGEGHEITIWANASHTFIEFKLSGHQTAQLNTNGPADGPRLYTMVPGKEGSYNPHPASEGYVARTIK